MAENLYFLHHAPAPRRPHEIVGSRIDRDLGEYGERVARIYAERVKRLLGSGALQGIGNTIVTSPLRRALQTTETIAAANGLNVQIDDRLKAQNFGVLEGKTFDEIHADPELAKNMWDYIPPEERTDHRAPLAESNRDLIGRIVEVRKDLYTRNESPLVITHGSVIDVIVSIHEKARLDALEGVNRRFEGRVIEDTWQGISPIGQPGEQFDHIPGTEKAIAEGDAEALKRALLAYISSASVDEEERIHLAKLIHFI